MASTCSGISHSVPPALLSLLTFMFQQMPVPLNSFVSVQWITVTLLMKFALNSNTKLELCWSVAAMKFLLQCEWHHFAKPHCLLLSIHGIVLIIQMNLVILSTFHGLLFACTSNGSEHIPYLYQLLLFQTQCTVLYHVHSSYRQVL
jgi:hypothetical protein